MSDGITAIGAYNPLSSIGLGASGMYGSYMDPTSMMGYGGMGYGPGMMGMMGMYNPSFMRQMTQAQQDMEIAQLQHAGAVHDILLQNKVNAHRAEDEALFKKSMEDQGIQGMVTRLAEKIRESDSDGICEEYDKLKIALYQKYHDELKANQDRIDPNDAVNGVIEQMYAEIISAKTGEQVSLKNDLRRFGESAFSHGFNAAFMGKKNYHGKYTEETLNYLYGTNIDNKGGKDRMEKIGGATARACELALSPCVGAVGGTAAVVGLAGLGKVVTLGHVPFFKTIGKLGKWGAAIGAGAALIGDIAWQYSRT